MAPDQACGAGSQQGRSLNHSPPLHCTRRKGRLRLPDLAVPPSLQEVGTMMRAGVVLSARVLISFGMVMYASALCVRMGSTTQASFEVVRQVGAGTANAAGVVQ